MNSIQTINYDKIQQFYDGRTAIAWLGFILTLITLATMIVMERIGRGKTNRKMVGIMLVWALAQFPFLVIVTTMSNQFMDHLLDKKGGSLSISYEAGHQQLTIFLILTIWAVIDTLLEMQLNIISDKKFRGTQSKQRKVGAIFFIVNLLFQGIFYGVITRQARATNEDAVKAAKSYDKNIHNLAAFIDILTILFIVVYLAIMAWQLMTLVQVIQSSIKQAIVKIALFILLPILTLLYINDVVAMMLWYWGAPAYTMTILGGFCMEKLWKLTNLFTVELTSTGGFLNFVFSVAEVTPLIWTLFFSFICLALQYKSSKQKSHPYHTAS